MKENKIGRYWLTLCCFLTLSAFPSASLSQPVGDSLADRSEVELITAYMYSTFETLVLSWRSEDAEEFQSVSPSIIGPGRTSEERMWNVSFASDSEQIIEFFLSDESTEQREPLTGFYKTPLKTFLFQDEHLFTYVPASRVSPSRRDYDPDNPPIIESEILDGETRPYRVMLPRGYDEHSDRRYPVIYFHDGQAIWEVAPGFTAGRNVVDPDGQIMSELVRSGEIGEMIAVGIDSTVNRTRDYLAPGDLNNGIPGAADRYVAFLLDELKPIIDDKYRTKHGPESTFTAGYSFGGIVALYMGWEFTDSVTRVGAGSGSFWSSRMPSAMGRQPKRNIRIYLDSGSDNYEGVASLYRRLLRMSPPYLDEIDLRYHYDPRHQHVTEHFAERMPNMLTFLYPGTEPDNELVPRLEISVEGSRVSVSWSVLHQGMQLSHSVSPTGLWSLLDSSIAILGDRVFVEFDVLGAIGFYRIEKP